MGGAAAGGKNSGASPRIVVDEIQLCGLGRGGVIAGLTLTPLISAPIWEPVIVLAGTTEDVSDGFHVVLSGILWRSLAMITSR